MKDEVPDEIKDTQEDANQSVIDLAGYRHNVAIVMANPNGQVFLAKRRGMDAWQFPQGGLLHGESSEEAMYRELEEEIGVVPDQVKLIGRTRGWLRYKLPHRLRRSTLPRCIGQKQIWFLLEFQGNDEDIRLDATETQEFDEWQWVSYWYPLEKIIDFKREVYSKGLKELLLAWHASRPKRRQNRY